jgi:hypothetical protein
MKTPMITTNKNQKAADAPEAPQRLEYLRGELRAERISYGELAELQSLAAYIKPDDVELLEAAGVPEQPQAQPQAQSPKAASHKAKGFSPSKNPLGFPTTKQIIKHLNDKVETRWKLWEEIDRVAIFSVNADPDDLSFGRTEPICIIPLSTPFEFAKLISKAPETKAHAERLADALRATRDNADASRKGYVEIPIEAWNKAVYALDAYEEEAK